MSITFACDCGRDLRAPASEAGRRWVCPGCIDLVPVPMPTDRRPELTPSGKGSGRRGSREPWAAGVLLLMASGLPLCARDLGLAAAGTLALLLICLGGIFVVGRG
jgi:hypothetical protein